MPAGATTRAAHFGQCAPETVKPDSVMAIVSPESAGVLDDCNRCGESNRYYSYARFDRGARVFAFCCALLYAFLSIELIDAIVTSMLKH